MQAAMKKRAAELLQSGEVNRVVGWKIGEFAYDVMPYVFKTAEEIERDFVYNEFCGCNLSKFIVRESQKSGKLAVFFKPCDTYSFNQLLSEKRVVRENVYICGVECNGMVDTERLSQLGISGITDISRDFDTLRVITVYGIEQVKATDVLAERCISCKSKKAVVYDEFIGKMGDTTENSRFSAVEQTERMSPDERFAFWRGELSRCIRCNACRNACPACTCEKCIFDNPNSGFENKAAADSFEENMFHIIRAFHVAGRCTDCGECSRVCPMHIPLHLLNRKFIKDINEMYGEYQAGEQIVERDPLTAYCKDDPEPSDAIKRSEEQ